MEDYSSWKDITYRRAFSWKVLDVDDFWGHKARGTASHKQIFVLVSVGGKAKVADGEIHLALPLEHDVLGLEVSVDDVALGEMTESPQKISHYLFDLEQLERFVLL